MGLSSAVDWWEEWQLRILVISSQCIQWFLFFSASRRKSIVSASFRVLIWLAYLGSDAVAIYALAALFNRHRKEQRNTLGESILEVVWAPVLLMHLGGQDCMTAYNMEDNELWRRHALTAVSQITVSIYVFCKSWRGGDKKLLQAAIKLFTLGGIRCLEKPFALQKASINSLVSSSDTIAQSLPDNKGSSCWINSLEVYVKQVRDIYQALSHKAQGKDDGETPRDPPDQARVEGVTMTPKPLSAQPEVEVCIVDPKPLSDEAHVEVSTEAPNYLHNQAQGEGQTLDDQEKIRPRARGKDQVNKLFVDLASPYRDRLDVTESFLKLN